MSRFRVAVVLLCCACPAAPVDGPADGRDDAFDAPGKSDGALSSEEAAAVLRVANEAGLAELDDDAGLDRRAAEGIVAHRQGADGTDGTGDDDPFDDLAELDAVPWVGPSALARLLDHAAALGWLDSPEACLMISEYLEGKHAYNKAVELYNCGDDPIALGEYSMCLVRNDDHDCTVVTPLADIVLDPGGVWTTCRSQRDHLNDPYPQLVERCDEELGSVLVASGDDRLVVLHTPAGERSVTDATVMDALGRIEFRPSWNPWNDVDLRRCNPALNPGTVFFEDRDWFTVHNPMDFTDLGVPPAFGCD